MEEDCSVAWKGQFQGREKKSTVILEAVASSYDLWIWHVLFASAGSLNDINVMNRSHLFQSITHYEGLSMEFEGNNIPVQHGIFSC